MSGVFKRGEALAVEVPEHIAKALDLREGDGVDFDLLNNEMAAFKKRGISEDEVSVLRKLSEIRFADRTKETVRKALTDTEQKALGALMKMNAVSFYEEGKYAGHGVYSIAKDYYLMLNAPTEKPTGVANPLGAKGFVIAHSFNEAEALLTQLDKEIRLGNVVGVRGFDKSYYFTTREAVNTEGSKIIAALEDGELTLQEIAEKCAIDESLARAVIEVLRESGDMIEKRKGLYALA
jgi:antitoxin component of MazEF toxin-antitoxin module